MPRTVEAAAFAADATVVAALAAAVAVFVPPGIVVGIAPPSREVAPRRSVI